MDSVITYLPSPVERNKQFQCFENNLCGRAFKIIHDKQKGPLVFFRVFAGKFIKGQKIYNIHQNISEQTGRLLVAYADDFEEVPEVTNGNIAVVTGLKVSLKQFLLCRKYIFVSVENCYRRYCNNKYDSVLIS